MRTTTGSLLLLILITSAAQGQVAVNATAANPDNSAMLDITSTTKGLLTPRMTTTERLAITSPATGLMVYDNTLSHFFYYTGSNWQPVATATSGWSINGNSGTVSGTNFIGTADNKNFDIGTNNILHTRIRTTGHIETLNIGGSTYLGENAGVNDDRSSRRNIAVGYNALSANVTGSLNTAIGYLTMQGISGSGNVGIGFQNMAGVSTGSWNVAYGQSALAGSSANCNYNTALGGQSNGNITVGAHNVSIGMNTMFSISSGSGNVAVGGAALNNATTGSNNTCIGYLASSAVTTLTNSAAIGYNARVEQNNSMALGGLGADAVKVGIGIMAPLSTLHVVGSVGATVKSGLVAGTTNPDNTASIWSYNSGTGTITLPAAASYQNRLYIIVNKTAAAVSISSYYDKAGTAQTNLLAATSITIVSDGSNWVQIR